MQKYSKSAAVVSLLYVSMLAMNVFAGMQKTTMASDQISTKTVSFNKKIDSVKTTAKKHEGNDLPKRTKGLASLSMSDKKSVGHNSFKASTSNLKSQNLQNKKVNSPAKNQANFSQVSTYWKSGAGETNKQLSNREMKIYAEPNEKAKVITKVKADQNFTVSQGDWVKVRTSDGKEGWALAKSVEQSISDAWNGEYQVIINGPSSNYSVTKISPSELARKQQAMREKQIKKMKKLSKLWEEEFFAFNDEKDTEDEIKDLKTQVLALNEKIKGIEKQESGKKTNA